jgi:predicted enzyme related to lactoylglutathione lyase
MFPVQGDGHPGWGVDFWIDDVERGVEVVRRRGGEVLQGPFDAPPAFTQAVVSDPGGAVLSISQLHPERLPG